MTLEFVNHSSFIIRYNEINLISDPWLEGTAFDNGWNLLSETKFNYSEFEGITHIWFSHEHPDHFSPPNLMKIPIETRKKITVLFQETTDKKVADFCKKANFKNAIELIENTPYYLSEDFSITCNPYTDGDSYSILNVNNFKILNLNDCIVDTEKKALDIKSVTGTIDVLLTQFGYASKIGNTEDLELRKKASEEKLKRIEYQFKNLNPKIIIPFASFIYYSHEENFYMNNGANRIDTVFDYIENQLKTSCNVLYPGDIWNVNTKWDSKTSINNYLIDYKKIETKKLNKSKKIEENQLIKESEKFIKTLIDGYPYFKRTITSLKCDIHINDYNKTFRLCKKGLISRKIDRESCDISISSEALFYCFRELWGSGTLNVNGRFQVPKKGQYWKFRLFSKIALALNRKDKFPIPETPTLIKKIQNRIKLN